MPKRPPGALLFGYYLLGKQDQFAGSELGHPQDGPQGEVEGGLRKKYLARQGETQGDKVHGQRKREGNELL
jgi:hypothetical protein